MSFTLIKNKDYQAGKQLVLIGEQNSVRQLLKKSKLSNYDKFYKIYNGDIVLDESKEYLENFKRLVRLIGDSFPDTGIEI